MLLVGARLYGQASSLTYVLRVISAYRASFDSGLAVKAMIGSPMRLIGRNRRKEFVGVAAVGYHQANVSGYHHSEITVNGFGGMDVKRWLAGAGKGGGDLAADVPRLADSQNQQASPVFQNQFDGPDIILVQAVDQIEDGIGFDLQNTLCNFNRRGQFGFPGFTSWSILSHSGSQAESCSGVIMLGPSHLANSGLS